MADECESKLQSVTADLEGVNAYLDKFSQGPDQRFIKDVQSFIADEARMLKTRIGRKNLRLRCSRNLAKRFRYEAGKTNGKGDR